MNLDRVTSGHDCPNDVNVIIEIPSHADPVKYEVDKDTGAMFVDRFMGTAMHYPCNYGYIPHTAGHHPGAPDQRLGDPGAAHRHAQDDR